MIFDYESEPAKQAARREVIRALVAGGGRLIDTAAAYGSAEDRLGEIVAALGVRDKLFLAAEFDAKTWAQFFLKFILGHPAVTAVIPGTDKPEYMLDNLQAGRGPLPDAAMRRRIVHYWGSLT